MNPSAHVTSVPALEEFRASLCTFIDQAKDAVITLDMDIRHTLDWLSDQATYWRAEIRAAENAVFQAKNELSRRKMLRIGDRPPDTIEQEETLELAKERLGHAEEKLANTRRWLLLFPEEVREFEGPSRLLQNALESDLPRMAALLEQKIAALEAYAQINVAPPR